EYGQAASGTKTMCFKIYDASGGGSQMWTSGDVSVTVSNGVFTYTLQPDVDWRGKDYWIETTINNKILTPREKLTTQVYALHARTAEDIEKSSGQNIHFAIGNSTYVVISNTGTVQINGSLEVSASLNSFIDRGDPLNPDYDDLDTDGEWHDLDLSSIVPADAKAVLLYVAMRDDTVQVAISLRREGNTNLANVGQLANQVVNAWVTSDYIIPCNSDRVIEYQTDNTTFTDLSITVKGWWK
ncbi:MAG: hypothetical protein JW803_06325, partial [Endomicrobiales bacterium]|nr:hypothetical protein [Endomicrobiales bacterium]